MKDLSIKTVVAIGIGSAIFFVLGRFVAIPSGIPNTNITIQYAVLSMFALIFGPVAGFLIGLIGHTLIDLSWGGSPWWSWVISSAVFGLIVGLITKKINIDGGEFKGKNIAIFVVACVIANIVAWCMLAPTLDIQLYAEPADKVYVQGKLAGFINFVASGGVGTILSIAYAKTKVKQGSLSVEE